MNKLKGFLLFISLLLPCSFCSSCSIKDKAPGYFYTLQEAYFLKRINQEELIELADVHNNDLEIDDDLNSITVNRIKRTEIYNYKNSDNYNNEKISKDNISIDKYYGKIGNCYAVIVSNDLEEYIQTDVNTGVANITFNYSNNNEILLWSKEGKTDIEIALWTEFSYYCKSISNSLRTIDNYINLSTFKYYGEYNGAYVYVYSTGGYCALQKETIKDYIFIYNDTGYYIRVVYNGCVYNLKEAYLNGILSYKDIGKIYEQAPNYGSEYNNSPEVHGDPIL